MFRDLTKTLEGRILGQTAGHMPLYEKDEHRQVAARLAEQARRRLLLFSYDLDAPIFDQQPFLDSVKKLAISSHQSVIRILLQDNIRVQREGHRLVELARSLPSRIELRRPHADFTDHAENFLVVDGAGYIRRELYSRYEGTADFYAPLVAQRLEGFFAEVWERSEPDSELRRLSL